MRLLWARTLRRLEALITSERPWGQAMGQVFHANTFSEINTETPEIPKRHTYMRPNRNT
jgi:hypothetical protein